MMSRGNDFVFMTEYVKNILYFATVRHDKQIKSTPETHYFSIDSELIYENYYSDFGPLNLGCVYKYCKLLTEKLKLFLNKQAIVHYASSDPRKAANAVFLMGCYGVLHLGLCPKDALKPLTKNGSLSYRPFQDATEGESIYTITILDCLKAIKKARDIGFFNFKDFNFEEYDRLDKIAGGDLNWIVPGKFLAFIGPVDYSVSLYHPPEIYIDYFLENDVKVVIRLNKRLYDGDVFNKVGITHHDLFFADGSCPPRHILFKFLQLSEEASCAIAVHCKAGLGRTGSLIGSYLIKHYRMTAREAIGWMRICRPGSVIGHQQGWLEQLESWLLKQGNFFRKKYFNDVDRFPVHAYGVYSIAEKATKKKPNLKLFEKAHHSPPPPIQWSSRSERLPAPRPRASKVREAAAVNTTQDELERSTGSSKESVPVQRTLNKGDQNERSRCPSRRGNCVGGGERPSDSPSCNSSKSSAPGKTKPSPRGRTSGRPNINNNDWRRAGYNPGAGRSWPIGHFYTCDFGLSFFYSPCDQNERSRCPSRRGNCVGGGERPSDSPSCNSSKSSAPGKTKPSPRGRTSGRPNINNNGTCVKNTRPSRPISPTSSPMRTPAPDNRNSQARGRDTRNTESRLNRLNQVFTVTPHKTYKVAPIASDRTTAMFSTAASRGSIQTNPRRRLGRSPSPSPSPAPAPARVLEHTRATNTPNISNSGSKRSLTREASKISLKKALSRLKDVTGPRNGSIGGHSFGAASLGAQRGAPIPHMTQRSPRVQSDERTVATQGDMLNSIKFQRRLRGSEFEEKILSKLASWERPALAKNVNPLECNVKKKKTGS